MPTEEELRAAFRDLERHTPDPADVLRAVHDDPRRPARPGHRRRALRAGLVLGAAGAVAAVVVIAVVAHGPAAKPAPNAAPNAAPKAAPNAASRTAPNAASKAAPALRTHLLAAIGTARSDVLYADGGAAPGGGTWQSPAYPQPGQEVHFRILGLGSAGAVIKDGEYSFRMPPGDDAASSYIANLDQGGLQLSGTLMAVNESRHVWGVWHGHFVLGFVLDATGIRAEIANGQFKVVGRTELHGQRAVELEINVPPSDEAPPHVTAARLWVNATTYLPMRQYVLMSNGQQNVTDYTFLPPAPGNLAKLRPVIPAGYTHVSGTSAELFSR